MGRKKKEIKMKEPVRIREKDLADGNKSLYLDMYYKGERKKETLKLYLVPEVNAMAKLQNANTRKLAEQIKAQRILDIQEAGLVDWEKVKRQRITLLDWMDECINDKAGIEKDFTFHSSRHTAATLAITAGAELYTVSKILGHSSIASTQVYAKVNMEKKVEAVSLFDGAFE